MAKFSRTPGKCAVFTLLVCGALTIAGQAMGKERSELVAAPVFMGTSAIISSLARQIGFVKTFSADYPYQYEQEAAGEKKGNMGTEEPEMRAK